MREITELIVRVADLVEAEGRVLRGATVRTALGVGTIALAVVALAVGVAILLGVLYFVTASAAGVTVGALVTGGAALSLGVSMAWLGYRIGH